MATIAAIRSNFRVLAQVPKNSNTQHYTQYRTSHHTPNITHHTQHHTQYHTSHPTPHPISHITPNTTPNIAHHTQHHTQHHTSHPTPHPISHITPNTTPNITHHTQYRTSHPISHMTQLLVLTVSSHKIHLRDEPQCWVNPSSQLLDEQECGAFDQQPKDSSPYKCGHRELAEAAYHGSKTTPN